MLRTRMVLVFGFLASAYGSMGSGCFGTCPACDDDNLRLVENDAGTRSFELRILDPSPSLSVVPRAYEGGRSLWLSDKLLAAIPSRARILDVGASFYPTGSVSTLAGDDKATTQSASIVSFVIRPTERFLVVGTGHVELQLTNGAPSLAAAGSDTKVIRIDSATPETKCSGIANAPRAQLSWKAPAHGEPFRTITSQTWDSADACIAVVFDDGEKLSACLPKRAWPFEVGDSVRIPINGKDDRRLEIHGTAAQHDMLALERGKMIADSISGAVTVQADTLRLELTGDDACRDVDAACGTSRLPVASMLTFANGKGTLVSRGGPTVGDDKLGVEQRWVLGAWIEPVGSSSCTSKEEPPSPPGASVEIVTRIKQPRS